MLDAYTHCKTYNPILTFLCALLLCINYLYGYQSTCVIQLMLFDLKNIVKFRRNEKKLCGRAGGGGGVVESKEDKKYMTKTPS